MRSIRVGQRFGMAKVGLSGVPCICARLHHQQNSLAGVGFRVIWVEFESRVQEGEIALEGCTIAGVAIASDLQEQILGCGIVRPPQRQDCARIAREPDAECSRDLLRDVDLNAERITNRSVIDFRPAFEAIAAVNQLRTNADYRR